LIDDINSKIVLLEKGVVSYGANTLSLLPVVLFMSSILYMFMFMCDFFFLLHLLAKLVTFFSIFQYNKPH